MEKKIKKKYWPVGKNKKNKTKKKKGKKNLGAHPKKPEKYA